MAKYLLLIYGDEQEWAAMSAEERRELDEGHVAFVAAAGAAVLDSQELEPANVATTLRADACGPAHHDGRAVPGDQGGASAATT